MWQVIRKFKFVLRLVDDLRDCQRWKPQVHMAYAVFFCSCSAPLYSVNLKGSCVYPRVPRVEDDTVFINHKGLINRKVTVF